jgi:hypothetical protein
VANPLAFFCNIQRYGELCDMYDGKVVDYALVSPSESTSALGRGKLEVMEDKTREPTSDGVWVTIEIHAGEPPDALSSPHGDLTLSEKALALMVRGPDDSEADWVLDGHEPEGVSAAEA